MNPVTSAVTLFSRSERSNYDYHLVDITNPDGYRAEIGREFKYKLIPNDPKLKPMILSGSKLIDKLQEIYGTLNRGSIAARCMITRL